MKLLYLIMVLIFVTGVMTDQWPAETNTNLVKLLTFTPININSTRLVLQNMEYDSETGDYFYGGFFVISRYHHPYFIWRMNFSGDMIWINAYFTRSYEYINRDTLQYSPTNQELYFIYRAFPQLMVRVNSSSGDLLGKYQISGSSWYSWRSNKCRLSSNGLANFWNMPAGASLRYVFRFNTTSYQIDKVTI